MPRILIIEDEPAMQEGLRFNLEYEGHEVEIATDGYAGLAAGKKNNPDLIVLDLMLPGLGGLEILKRLRQDGVTTPVVILTARGQEADKIAGLDVGADDYVTKPFSVRELMARIDAVLRRAGGRMETQVPPRFQFGDVQIDFERRTVTRAGEVVPLSYKEFEIMRLFVRRQGQIVSREELLDQVWGYSEDTLPNTRTVDTHIAKLRKKLEGESSRGRYIQTVHKVGYRFQVGDGADDAPAART